MAFNLSKELAEQERREAGMWIDIADGAKIQMSDPRSLVFQKAMQKEEFKYRKRNAIRAGKDLSMDQRADVMWRAMFGIIVMGWEGVVEDKNSKQVKVEFTLENFLRMMNESWRFREAVMAFATDEDTFEDSEDLEELAKNSD